MKKIMLGFALVAGAACGSDDVAIETTSTTGPENSTTTAPEPTTTVAPTTTTEPEPVVEDEPVVTTLYVPVTPRRTTTTSVYEPPSPQGSSTRGDGGWAIPAYIVMCESGGSWTAENASGAAGPYQLMPEHFGGESALNQSRAAQHAKAAQLWNGGAGRSNWAACL